MPRPCSRGLIPMSISSKHASSHGNHGIIVVDKPEGLSSARTIHYLKKFSWVNKVGHTGTLDPFATGIMICGINQGTRLSQFFLKGDKTYVAELVLGIETDTQDATGKIVSAACPENVMALTEAEIRETIKSFEGEQQQSPPIYSALKHQGEPLYKLARMGKPVQKPPRPITIKEIRIFKIALPSVIFEVSCSSGTYIRTLSADIGNRLKCGGHLKTLRRTESCGFTLKEAVPFSLLETLENEEILKQRIIPMSTALKNMDEVIIDQETEKKIKVGMPLENHSIPLFLHGPYVKLVNADQSLIAVVTHDGDTSEYKYCCVFNH